MKNEILDDIFQNQFRDYLERDEEVIWEGQPRKSKSLKRNMILKHIFLPSIVLLYFWYFFTRLEISFTILFFIGLTSIVFNIYFDFTRGKKTRYMLTQKRILFLIPRDGVLEFFFIPLNQVQHIDVEKKGTENGTIFLRLNENYRPERKTINLENNKYRNIPTLELVDEPEMIAKHIRKIIYSKL